MLKIQDLRSYLEVLEDAGQLFRVSQPVSLVHELANVAATVQRQGRGAVLFEQPEGSTWPVFAGAVGSATLAALALECEVSEIIEKMEQALDPMQGIAPQIVTSAQWQQNIVEEDAVDLQRLPIPTHGLHDGGPFITGGITISKDPINGRGNLSYNRMQVLGPRTLGFNVNEWRHVMQFFRRQEAKAEPLEIAVAIGVDPAISIAAGARYDDDELNIAGAIRGEGVPICRGVSVDLNIPALAEIVIEGYLAAGERRKEGPLAEFHGYYGELWSSPVFKVSTVSYRDSPIFQTIIPGHNEHIYIGNVLPREPLLLRFVRHVSQNVTGLHIPPYGNGFLAIVQIKKSNPGEAKNVALAAFTAHVNIKTVIIVDPDVNIYDPSDMLWSLTNRVDWGKDFFVVPGSQGHEMDPTADARGIHTKIGIDATYKPEHRNYGDRIHYPDVDLNAYI
ncbi:MAG: UbiD family decarboxylase [Candidatus Promineifilaceae bacterium]